nr:ClassA_beta_lactamase [uncultured bacterium]
MSRRILSIVIALAVPVVAAPLAAQGAPKLERQIAAIAPLSGGTVGVAATHLESGRSVFVNADDQFPLASTYKVPIAIQAFKLVEEGKLSLDQMVPVLPTDIHIGSEWNKLFQAPGVSLSFRNVIEPMLIFSENSATDLALRLVGGGEAVTARLRALGINDMRIDRSTADVIAGPNGVPDVWANGVFSKEKWQAGTASVSRARRDSAAYYYANDPRDHGSPRAMLTILTRLWKGELLNKANTAYMLDIMYRCETGQGRIKGMLPPGTRVAHKTGTFPGTTNDVGVIDLPDGTHVAIAVYIKKSSKVPGADLEATIAQVSRAAYDYFLFTGEQRTGDRE